MPATPAKPKDKSFKITIDEEPYDVTDKTMTASALIELADEDPKANYLVEKHGKSQTSYEGKGDDVVHLHQGSKFITVPTGPTTVS